MFWLPIHDTLPDHPKLSALASALGVHPMQAMGHLTSLWLWASAYCEDGNLTKYGALAVARGARWDGDAELFVTALVSSGFADAVDNQAKIHDWAEYIGKVIARRKESKERAAKARGPKKDNPSGVRVRCAHCARTEVVPNADGTRSVCAACDAEKRREEERRLQQQDAAAAIIAEWKKQNPKKSGPITGYSTNDKDDARLAGILAQPTANPNTLIADLKDVRRETGEEYAFRWFLHRWEAGDWGRRNTPQGQRQNGAPERKMDPREAESYRLMLGES